MTTKKKTADTQADSPSLLLDAYGNPGLVAAGGLIESAWGNAVVGRVILRFPNEAAMNATSPPTGTLAVTLDNSGWWIRIGSGWRVTAIGNRLAFRLVGGVTAQAIPPSAFTVATFSEAFDPNGIVSGGTFTVPAGWDGRWTFEWGVRFKESATGTRQSFLSINSSNPRLGVNTTAATTGVSVEHTGSASYVMPAGWTANVAMYQSNVAMLDINDNAYSYFQGYYVGPY